MWRGTERPQTYWSTDSKTTIGHRNKTQAKSAKENVNQSCFYQLQFWAFWSRSIWLHSPVTSSFIQKNQFPSPLFTSSLYRCAKFSSSAKRKNFFWDVFFFFFISGIFFAGFLSANSNSTQKQLDGNPTTDSQHKPRRRHWHGIALTLHERCHSYDHWLTISHVILIHCTEWT